MNYFTELLESYSRLKKRSLKLLEASKVQLDPNAKAIADQFIGQAQSVKIDQAIPVNHPQTNKQIGTIYSSVDKKQNPIVVFNGFPGAKPDRAVKGTAQSGQNYNDFVNLLSSDQSSNAGSKEGSESDEATPSSTDFELQPAAPPYSTFWDFNFWKQKLNPQNLSNTVRSILKKVKNPDLFIAKFSAETSRAGTVPQMIENFVALKDVGGQLELLSSTEGDNIELKEDVSKTLQRAFDILTQDGKLQEADKLFIKDRIIISSKNRIIVKGSDATQGLIFSDTQKSISEFFIEAARQKSIKLSKRTFSSSTNEDNRIRGKMMEDLPVLIHAIATCQDEVKKALMTNCQDAIEEIVSRYEGQVEKNNKAFKGLKEVEEKYNGDFAVDMNDSETIGYDELRRMFGDNAPREVLKTLQNFAIAEYRLRRPDFIIPMGEVVGEGRRSDNLEVYTTKEKAIAALKRQGFDDKQINSLIVNVDAGKICSENKSSLCPKSPSGTYFGVNVSLKNYLNFEDGVCIGSGSENTRESVLNDSPETVETRRALQDTFGSVWAKNKEGIQNLQKEISRAKNLVSGLSSKVITTGPKGGKTLVNQMDQFCETFVKQINRETLYGDSSKLTSTLKDFIKGSYKNPERLKALITSYLEGQILSKKLESKDRNERLSALGHMATTAFISGGSSDLCLLSARSLQHKDLLVAQQNDLFYLLKEKMENPDNPNINIRITDSGRAFIVERGRETLKCETSFEKSGRRVYSTSVSLTSAEMRSKKTKKPNKGIETGPTEESSNYNMKLIVEYIQNSQVLINKLMKSIKTN